MVQVTSEIGRLRKVLVHEPGLEVDHMVPAAMDQLLFDDVIFGDRAREEHRLLRRVFQVLDVETVEALDLLGETLENPEARRWLLQAVAEETEGLENLEQEPEKLARSLTEGLRRGHAPGVEVQELFRVSPLPNWCFQRDPQIVVGNGVIFCSMASPARQREALLSRAIFRFHPELSRVPVLHDPLAEGGAEAPALEGGDLTVLSPDVIAVGHSARTNRAAIESLARSLARTEGGPRWLLVVELPQRRAYMHLDTVITVLDRGTALVYPPVVLAQGHEEAKVHEIDLHAREPVPRGAGKLLQAMETRGISLRPVACGGDDPLRQQREQWTDGANALALAPGVVLLYERNTGTAEALSRAGFQVVRGRDLVLGSVEIDPEESGPTCVLVPSNELSRARGGPHCLTHPLVRDPL